MSLGPSPTQEQLDKQEYLNKKMKEFLGKGGKIEKIPSGLTGDQYREDRGIKKAVNKFKKKLPKNYQ